MKKNILITSIVVVIGLVTYTGLAHHFLWWPFQVETTHVATGIDYQKPTPDQLKNGANIKQQNIDNSTSGKSGSIGSDPSPAPTPSPNGSKATVPVTISSATISNSTLSVRTIIGYVTNSGTCTISLSTTSTTVYSADSGVQSASSTSTCKGFVVNTNTLPHGQYTLTISFSNDNVQGKAVQQVTL